MQKNIKLMLCKFDDLLLNAMKLINVNGKGTVFIIDDAEKLCGIVTDGDIRRALLAGKALHTKVNEILGQNFIYAHAHESIDQVRARITERIKIIPIIDKRFHVIDYVEDRSKLALPIAFPDLNGNELNYLIDAFLSTRISNRGSYIDRFEANFAQFVQCKHGVAVSNGTVALQLALLALGVKKNDEVIIPDLTFAATINAVLHLQATPVIVDIEPESWCIDPDQVEKAITKKTKAIIPVHLYGQPCDMQRIMQLAKRHTMYVIEDCAEAHGAQFKNKPVGSFGDISCFSFYGNKIITTGEGGMCVTNSKKLNNLMRQLRDHGMSASKKYWHDRVGYNFRMTNLQAAIGVAQLERIKDTLEKRDAIEKKYKSALSSIKKLKFQNDSIAHRKKITWLVSILVDAKKRNTIIKKLNEKGIDARTFFYSLSLMSIYKKYVFSKKIAQRVSLAGINLPTATHYLQDDSIFKRCQEIIKEICT